MKSLAILLLAAAPVRADWNGSAGTQLTAGTGGYTGVSLRLDGERGGERPGPYGGAEFLSDSFSRQVALTGGARVPLGEGLSARAGVGGAFGRLKETDRTMNSLILEASGEKAWEAMTAGASWRYTSGRTAGAGTALRGAAESARASRRARGIPPEDEETYTFHELGASLAWLAGPGWVFGRLALGLPSYADKILSETIGYALPVTGSVSIAPAVAFEQGARRAVYFSLGASWKMGGGL